MHGPSDPDDLGTPEPTLLGPLDPDDLAFVVQQVRGHAVIRLGLDGAVRSWNSGAEQMKGYTAAEVLGESFTRFYTEGDRAAGVPGQLLAEAARTGVAHQSGWRVRKDGTRFWADVSINAVRDRAGELAGFLKVTRDLSDERRAELARQHYYSALAHDLRTPLTSAAGYVDLARLATSVEEADAHLDRVSANLERLAQMMDDLLEVARGHTDAAQPHPEAVDAAWLVRDLVDRLAGEADAARVVVPTGAAWVHADPGALERIVLNLVSNALRCSEGPVDVTVDGVDGAVRVSVRDTGRGIHPDDLASIFEPGERGRLAVADDGGHGIGLASVRRLVEQLGGRTWIESEVGRCTTAHVELPPARPWSGGGAAADPPA